MSKYLTLGFSMLMASVSFSQQQQTSKPSMDFEKYEPVSTLVVPEHKRTASKFPFIDVHNHQFQMGTQDLSTLIKEMDRLNMKVMVNLSGQGGEALQKMLQNVRANYPKRFIIFTNINFNGIGDEGWTEKSGEAIGRRCKEWRQWAENL
ncbi:MAG TPA: hypothetical protein VD996_00335 [Chitinophagaceae bacterium]|nr:hypothetical protein [Chitinophagaceae bacterium]